MILLWQEDVFLDLQESGTSIEVGSDWKEVLLLILGIYLSPKYITTNQKNSQNDVITWSPDAERSFASEGFRS